MWKFLASLLLSLTFASASFWQACPNTNAVAPDDVVSPYCSETSCTAVRGQRLVANVTFTPRLNHNDLKVEVWATILGVQVRLPADPPHDNACNSIFQNNVRVSCPITANIQYVWVIEMQIPTNLPALNNARVRYEILDGSVEVLCATIIAVLI